MRYMIGFPISWVICYFMFAFINFALDAGSWDMVSRTLCSIFGMVWGAALSYRIAKDCSWSY